MIDLSKLMDKFKCKYKYWYKAAKRNRCLEKVQQIQIQILLKWLGYKYKYKAEVEQNLASAI